MKRFIRTLLTFACAAGIIFSIPACAHADEDNGLKPNVLTTVENKDKEIYWYWAGQTDSATIRNVKVSNIAAHSATISFDYELFNVKDLKKLAFIVTIDKYSKVLLTNYTGSSYKYAIYFGDINPADAQKDKDKKKDKKKNEKNAKIDYTKPHKIYFDNDPKNGYIYGSSYYSYNYPDKLPTKKKGHASVEISTKPMTRYANTDNESLKGGISSTRIEKGKIKKSIKPYIAPYQFRYRIADKVYGSDRYIPDINDKPVDIDVSSIYVGIHADYKDNKSIYFNNNAVQVPAFTTIDKDPTSQCSIKGKKNASKEAKLSDNADSTTPLASAFKRNPIAFIAALIAAILVIGCAIAFTVLHIFKAKKVKKADAAEEDENTDAAEKDESTYAAEEDDSTNAAEDKLYEPNNLAEETPATVTQAEATQTEVNTPELSMSDESTAQEA